MSNLSKMRVRIFSSAVLSTRLGLTVTATRDCILENIKKVDNFEGTKDTASTSSWPIFLTTGSFVRSGLAWSAQAQAREQSNMRDSSSGLVHWA